MAAAGHGSARGVGRSGAKIHAGRTRRHPRAASGGRRAV